jgi:hypothetical protein
MQDSTKKVASYLSIKDGQPPEVAEALQERLSPQQQQVLLHNGLVLAVRAASGNLPRSLAAAVDAHAKACPSSQSAGLLAAVASSGGTTASLLKQLRSHRGSALQLALLAGHIAANASPLSLEKVLSALQEDAPEGLRFAPALVATRVRAIQQYGDKSADKSGKKGDEKGCDKCGKQVEAQLREAVAWWEMQPPGSEQAAALAALLEPLAAACMHLGDLEGAAAAIGRLQVCISYSKSAMFCRGCHFFNLKLATTVVTLSTRSVSILLSWHRLGISTCNAGLGSVVQLRELLRHKLPF